MSRTKLETFVGFAKKTNSIVYGFEELKKKKNKVFGVLIDENLSEKTAERIKKICLELKIEFKIIKNLDDVFNTQNCKVVGFLNKNLAEQIMNLKE